MSTFRNELQDIFVLEPGIVLLEQKAEMRRPIHPSHALFGMSTKSQMRSNPKTMPSLSLVKQTAEQRGQQLTQLEDGAKGYGGPSGVAG